MRHLGDNAYERHEPDHGGPVIPAQSLRAIAPLLSARRDPYVSQTQSRVREGARGSRTTTGRHRGSPRLHRNEGSPSAPSPATCHEHWDLSGALSATSCRHVQAERAGDSDAGRSGRPQHVRRAVSDSASNAFAEQQHPSADAPVASSGRQARREMILAAAGVTVRLQRVPSNSRGSTPIVKAASVSPPLRTPHERIDELPRLGSRRDRVRHGSPRARHDCARSSPAMSTGSRTSQQVACGSRPSERS